MSLVYPRPIPISRTDEALVIAMEDEILSMEDYIASLSEPVIFLTNEQLEQIAIDIVRNLEEVLDDE